MKKRNQHFILQIIYMFGIIIIVLAAIFTIYIRQAKYIISYGATSSMTPAIPVGSLEIYSSQIPFYALKCGDIISYRSSDENIAHRVIKIEDSKSLIWTKGDANEIPDPKPVTQDIYNGKLIYTIPVLGFVYYRGLIFVAIIAVGAKILDLKFNKS